MRLVGNKHHRSVLDIILYLFELAVPRIDDVMARKKQAILSPRGSGTQLLNLKLSVFSHGLADDRVYTENTSTAFTVKSEGDL